MESRDVRLGVTLMPFRLLVVMVLLAAFVGSWFVWVAIYCKNEKEMRNELVTIRQAIEQQSVKVEDAGWETRLLRYQQKGQEIDKLLEEMDKKYGRVNDAAD